MCNKEGNIKVVGVNNYKQSGFDIYLNFSGRRELLMWHRHNGLLYDILRNGIRLNDLRRLPTHKYKGLRYLLMVIDEYLNEEAYATA